MVYANETNILNHKKWLKYKADDITLAVHLSADRLDRLMVMSQHWSGELNNFMKTEVWQHTYLQVYLHVPLCRSVYINASERVNLVTKFPFLRRTNLSTCMSDNGRNFLLLAHSR